MTRTVCIMQPHCFSVGKVYSIFQKKQFYLALYFEKSFAQHNYFSMWPIKSAGETIVLTIKI